jgi:SSS family solute:Na+ symporter
VLAYVGAFMAATLAPILGWTSGQVLAVFGGVTLVYLSISGFFAVAYNDVIQFVLLMGGNAAFGMLLLRRAGGFASAWDKIVTLRGADFLNPLPWGGHIGGITLLALCVQGLFFAGSPYAGEGWTAQRYLAARSERHAVGGQIFNGVLALVIRLIPFVIMGLAAAALFPLNTVGAPAELWGSLVKRYAPPGLFGLLLVGGLAGYMAAISSMVNWASSYLMNDLYRLSLRPHATDREYLWMSRLFSAVLLIGALAWGANIAPAQLDRWVLFINSALVVFPLPLAWLKWFWWRTNVYGEMAGILGAFPAGYIVWFGSDAVLPKSWGLPALVPAFGNLDRYPFWVGFSILFGLGWAAVLSATLLTRPESMEVLRDFYRTVRPIGFWGPVRASLAASGDLSAPSRAVGPLITCALGVAFHLLMTIAFFSLFGRRIGLFAAALAGTLVSGALFSRAALKRVPGSEKEPAAKAL